MRQSEIAVRPLTEDEPTLLEILRVLQREWRVIIGIISLAILLSVMVAFIIQPRYRAEVVISEVEQDQTIGGTLANSLGGLASLTGLDFGSAPGSAPHARALLHSRYLATEFIQRNDLVSTLLPPSDSSGTAANQTGTTAEPSLWQASKRFRTEVLQIGEDRTTGLITISIVWKDPEIAARWATQYVELANQILRKRALDDAQKNISYLQGQISKTNVVELQQVMYNLIQSEMQTLMLANVHEDFAFSTVDPAVPPELRFRPNRTLIVVSGTLLGAFVAGLVVAFRRMLRLQRMRDADAQMHR